MGIEKKPTAAETIFNIKIKELFFIKVTRDKCVFDFMGKS